MAVHPLCNADWSKQTSAAPVSLLGLHGHLLSQKHLLIEFYSPWRLIELPARQGPVTTTIILIRPIIAGMHVSCTDRATLPGLGVANRPALHLTALPCSAHAIPPLECHSKPHCTQSQSRGLPSKECYTAQNKFVNTMEESMVLLFQVTQMMVLACGVMLFPRNVASYYTGIERLCLGKSVQILINQLILLTIMHILFKIYH